jgi:ketosteroid isomerase-like protein
MSDTSSAPRGTSDSRSPADILRRYQQALVDRNADDLADLYAPDAVHEIPFRFPGMPPRFEGSEQVRAAYTAAWGATDARPREVRSVAVHRTGDPEVLVVEQVVVGVNVATGAAFELPGVLVLRVHDGRIVHVRDYMDALAVVGATRRSASLIGDLAADG